MYIEITSQQHTQYSDATHGKQLDFIYGIYFIRL